MSGYEWQCFSCGHQTDGYLHYRPDSCCMCGGTIFESADKAEKRESENRAINKHDDYLEELRNDRQ